MAESIQATHHYKADEITMMIDDRAMTLTNETTNHAEVQADKGPETTQTAAEESIPQRTAGMDAGMVTAKEEATQRVHALHMVELHMTMGKRCKPSHHDP